MTGNRTDGSPNASSETAKVSPAAIGASLALAALVISVFVSANSLSAEATLRRFIHAVNRGDPTGVRQTLWEPADSPVSGTVIQMARFTGSDYEVVNRQEHPDGLVIVVSAHRGTQPVYGAFVLTQSGGRWKVSATLTHRVTQSIPFRS